jgi:hypothetical protein
MSRYGLLHAPLLSFGNAAFYRDLARHWSGIGALYLGLVLAATWAVSIFGFFAPAFRQGLAELQPVIEQLPEIRISGGRATVVADQPYLISHEGRVLAVLDTTGAVTSLAAHPDAMVLLTETHLFLRQSHGRVQQNELPPGLELTLDALTVRSYEQWVGEWLPIGLYTGCVMVAWIYYLLRALVIALCVLLVVGGEQLGFIASLRIAVYASVPMILLDTVYALLPIPGMLTILWWLICVGATLAFAIGGGRAAAAVELESFEDSAPSTHWEHS